MTRVNIGIATKELISSRHHHVLDLLRAKHQITYLHSVGVGEMMEAFCSFLAEDFGGLPSEVINKGSAIHDAGKLVLPTNLLSSPRCFDEGSMERELIKTHPMRGLELVKDLPIAIQRMVIFHHERIDGKGYPRRPKKENIPLEARILSIVDTAVAVLEARAYKKVESIGGMISIIKKGAGTQFDPELVESFVAFLYDKHYSKKIDTLFLTQFPKSFFIKGSEKSIEIEKLLSGKR